MQKGWESLNRLPQKGILMTYLILGYDFECREFQYQGRTVKGLAFEVKTNEKNLSGINLI